MSGTVPEDDSADALKTTVLRRALKETLFVLREGSRVWAAFSCPGSAECCQLAVTKRPPWLWPSEWAVLRARLAREGRALPKARADGGCPFLDAEGRRCTVYEDRPLGCRTFFCQRVRGPVKLPREASTALDDRLAALNLAVDSEAEPRSILDWWASSVGGPGAGRHHDEP
ncbi:MAG: YkgJ family cysteine cluster protein [Myxococcota bacterium]